MSRGALGRGLVTLPVVGLLAGCGSGSSISGAGDPSGGAVDGVGRAAPPSGGDPAAALAEWRSFPVTADPRPLVLVGAPVVDPATGFGTGDAKLAYVSGAFETAVALPTAPATSAGYAVITARTALDRLRATGSRQPVAHPLRIVAVSLGQVPFGTDRGPRTLPAWRFTLDAVSGPVWVLAVAPKYLWQAHSTGSAGSELSAGLSADGRSLTYSFFGSPAGPAPCGAEYAATVAESPAAVVVSVHEVTPNPQGSVAQGGVAGSSGSVAQGCAAVGARRTATAELTAPLGARVLLTADGTPIAVVSR